ncbi:hypothetical protein BRC81_04650 [Halobacteriales archaeon QS_1_68_20]|nr:MAG: hypothetical protein BRC81_04650 [Halobacteriales archaeon QS_1_68_20]
MVSPGYAAVPLLAGLVSLVVVWSTLEHSDDPLGQPFVVLMGLIAVWALSDAAEFAAAELDVLIVLGKVTFTLGAFVPVVWFVLTVRYAGFGTALTRRRICLLFVEPILVTLLTWTNSLHGYIWTALHLEGESTTVLGMTFGPGFFAHLVYAYLLILLGISLLSWVFVREATIYRRQAGLLVVGAGVPTLANVAFVLGLSPIRGVDLTSSTFALTGVVFGLALFEFDLLELRPEARQRAIEEFGTGILVTDDADRVVHVNDTAREAFSDGITVGADAIDHLPVDDVTRLDGRVESTDVGGSRRFHDYRVTPITDRRDELVGHVVALRDVTELKGYEQRMEVTNRILRHNLRNDVNKIIGWADQLEDHVDEEGQDVLEDIETVARGLADLSREASRIDSTLVERDGDRIVVDVDAAIRSILADCRERWPDAAFRYDPGGDYGVLAPDDELLTAAVRNAVENAIEYNDAPDPQVTVRTRSTVEDGTTWVRLTVADNGPGIPDMEQETLLRGTETALKHGSGLGLWVINWVVTAAGGDLEFNPNEPRGSVVVLRLRSADD